MAIFDGKIMLVVGGARGMGRAAALSFARDGGTLVVADIIADAGEQTAADIRATGAKASFVHVDIGEETSVAALFAKIESDHGRLDHALNCAAITFPPFDIVDTPLDTWDRAFKVNSRGTFLCLRGELAMMKPRKSGSVVVIASGAGLRPARMASAYSASKFAVVGLTTAAALDMAPYGVRVNAICPGTTLTPMIEQWFASAPGAEDAAAASIPMGRLAVPDDMAAAASWLLSDAAAYVTGQAIPIDGGLLSCIPGS